MKQKYPYVRQFQKLYFSSPKPNLINWEVIDCDTSTYTNNSMSANYSMGCGFSESITHCYWTYHCKDCVDLSHCNSCEFSYECTDCVRCYNCDYCFLCENCSFTAHSIFLINSSYCFGCVGLKNKTYCIFNKQYTQEEYEKKIARLSKRSLSEIQKKVKKLYTTIPVPAMITHDSKNVSGNYLYQSENLTHSFDCYRSRDSIYCYYGYENIDCVDNSFTKATLCYECVGGGMYYNCDFCLFCESCQDSYFLFNCRDCKNCFGCVNLTHKQYYIFNIPYSGKEYFERVGMLKKEFQKAGMFGLQVFMSE